MKLRIMKRNIRSIQRYSFPRNPFYCLWFSQRPPASVRVKFKLIGHHIWIFVNSLNKLLGSCEEGKGKCMSEFAFIFEIEINLSSFWSGGFFRSLAHGGYIKFNELNKTHSLSQSLNFSPRKDGWERTL